MIRKWWGTGYLLYLQPKPWNGWNREKMSFNVQPCSSLLVSLQPMETAGRLQKVAVMAVTTVTVVLPWESVNIPQDHRESLKCPVCMPIKCETLYTIVSCPCPWGGAVWRQSQCQKHDIIKMMDNQSMGQTSQDVTWRNLKLSMSRKTPVVTVPLVQLTCSAMTSNNNDDNKSSSRKTKLSKLDMNGSNNTLVLQQCDHH